MTAEPLRVAVVGTGRMGGAMAGRVAAAGHPLTVWNRTRATAEAVATRARRRHRRRHRPRGRGRARTW